MDNKKPQEYIANIAKASSYFAFKNGPIKDLCKEGKISEEEINNIQSYMQNHLAYLYTVLLEENNLKKFDLVISTMNKFYVDDKEEVLLADDGFDKFYENLFPQVSNISINNIKNSIDLYPFCGYNGINNKFKILRQGIVIYLSFIKES